jgi:hypothetical protein
VLLERRRPRHPPIMRPGCLQVQAVRP